MIVAAFRFRGFTQARSFASASAGVVKYETTNKLWNTALEKYGCRPAITFTGKGETSTHTYAEMEALSNQYARLLQQQYGVERGDRVVTAAQNRLELVALFLACQKTAAVYTPLAPELARPDIEMLVDRYEGKVVVIDESTKRFGPTSIRAIDLANQAAGMDDAPLPDISKEDDTAIIFSTSGTTSLPKGVVWKSSSLATLYKEFYDVETPNEQWKQLLWVPLRGVVTPLILMSGLHAGAHNIFVDHFPSTPTTWGNIIKEYEIESMLLFGGAMAGMLQACPADTFKSVTALAYGGSPVPVTLSQQSMKQFPNAKFLKVWGMSEVGFGCILGGDGHVTADCGDAKKIRQMDSCGHPVAGCEAMIENPNENGEGQLLFSSPTMMEGYYKNPEKTKEDLPDGKWLRTGDLGKIDDDGNVYIVDRIKDVISTDMGQNVSPVDIEKVLMRHPAVGEAGVIGIMHPSHSGEMIVAWITTKKGHTLTVTEIKAFVEGSESLAPWQLPKVYEITDKPLPKPAGKVLKRALRSPEFVKENLGEHILAYMNLKPSWVREAEEVFDKIDRDDNGFLSVEEFSHVVGEKHSVAVVQAMDVNHDGGSVTRAKFLNLLWQLDDVGRQQLLLTMQSALAAWESEH